MNTDTFRQKTRHALLNGIKGIVELVTIIITATLIVELLLRLSFLEQSLASVLTVFFITAMALGALEGLYIEYKKDTTKNERDH